jgi:hypothetical protein
MFIGVGVGRAPAQDHGLHPPAGAGSSGRPSIGRAALEISCRLDARDSFLLGVSHLHSFSFQAARQAFLQTAKLDPSCAMAFWGEAISYYDFLLCHQDDKRFPPLMTVSL